MPVNVLNHIKGFEAEGGMDEGEKERVSTSVNCGENVLPICYLHLYIWHEMSCIGLDHCWRVDAHYAKC